MSKNVLKSITNIHATTLLNGLNNVTIKELKKDIDRIQELIDCDDEEVIFISILFNIQLRKGVTHFKDLLEHFNYYPSQLLQHTETFSNMLKKEIIKTPCNKNTITSIIEHKKLLLPSNIIDSLVNNKRLSIKIAKHVTTTISVDILSKDFLDQIELVRNNDKGIIDIPSGYPSIDRVTGGWKKGNLVTIGSRPAMGKSSLILNMMLESGLRFKKKSLFVSLDMSKEQIYKRMISIQSNIPYLKIERGTTTSSEWERINNAAKQINEANISITDSANFNLNELRSILSSTPYKNPYDIVYIDYLHLIRTSNYKHDNREKEIGAISRGLKAIAKEFNVSIIVLSQLSRAVETRGGERRPLLSDLRESGSIEQESDIVMFLYRPEYYGITEDMDGNSTEGVAEIMIAKNRNGSLENIPLQFNGKYMRFKEFGYTFSSESESIPF